MEQLKELYKERERVIKSRLKEFEVVGYRPEKAIFSELCFCLLTPSTRAERADLAVRNMIEDGSLFTGNREEIVEHLKAIRFRNNKAGYILDARKLTGLKDLLKGRSNLEVREWLVSNVKGLGWKEASHFLRNIGHGEGLAIIDRHLLKNLKEFGYIESIPTQLSKNKYFEFEGKVKEFSEKLGIPMEELDLLLWSKETGKVFK